MAGAMNAADFMAEVKRRVTRPCAAPDPLVEARRFLETSGLTAEGQMVRKSVEALGGAERDFGEADVHRLGAITLGLVSALAEAQGRRRYASADWNSLATAGL
jgi:hypothetical protein